MRGGSKKKLGEGEKGDDKGGGKGRRVGFFTLPSSAHPPAASPFQIS